MDNTQKFTKESLPGTSALSGSQGHVSMDSKVMLERAQIQLQAQVIPTMSIISSFLGIFNAILGTVLKPKGTCGQAFIF